MEYNKKHLLDEIEYYKILYKEQLEVNKKLISIIDDLSLKYKFFKEKYMKKVYEQ